MRTRHARPVQTRFSRVTSPPATDAQYLQAEIFKAVHSDDFDLINKILKVRQETVNAISNKETVLYAASSSNKVQAVNLLLDAGAHIKRGCVAEGQTPLYKQPKKGIMLL